MDKIKLNEKQIQNTLQFIHDTQSEDVKRSVFGELGRQCFCAGGMKAYFEKFQRRREEYFKRVNHEHSVQYWESILPGEVGRSYVLTGVPVEQCICSLADGGNAPLSLCATIAVKAFRRSCSPSCSTVLWKSRSPRRT